MLATTDPQFGYSDKLFKGFFILYTDCTIEFTIIKQCKQCSAQYFSERWSLLIQLRLTLQHLALSSLSSYRKPTQQQ